MGTESHSNVYAHQVVTRVGLAIAFAASAIFIARAATDPTYTGPENADERHFVSSIQSDLNSRFSSTDDAEKAGYVRYTNEDETGAISYANRHWNSMSFHDPSQLWYDKNGHLLGADYSVLHSNCKTPPHLWGVNPGRWSQLDGHIHWVARDAQGSLKYEQWMPDASFTAAGGNASHPSSQTLVAMRKVTSANDVVTIFHFPPVWDLTVWVKPNANGAFADKNPSVTP